MTKPESNYLNFQLRILHCVLFTSCMQQIKAGLNNMCWTVFKYKRI